MTSVNVIFHTVLYEILYLELCVWYYSTSVPTCLCSTAMWKIPPFCRFGGASMLQFHLLQFQFALSPSCVWRRNVKGSLKFVPALLWCCVCVRGCVDMACVRCLVLSALYFALFGGPWTGWGDPTEQSFVATGQCSVFYTNQRHVIAIPSPPTIRELGYTGVTVTVAFGLSHL